MKGDVARWLRAQGVSAAGCGGIGGIRLTGGPEIQESTYSIQGIQLHMLHDLPDLRLEVISGATSEG